MSLKPLILMEIGVSDCNDECPDNRLRSVKGNCGCESPNIDFVELNIPSACNNQGTNSPYMMIYFQLGSVFILNIRQDWGRYFN